MTSVAHAIQHALDDQAAAEIASWPPHTCEVLTCQRARFWRHLYDTSRDEVERLTRQITVLGAKPAPVLDGHDDRHRA